MEEIESKIPEFNLKTLVEYIKRKDTILYEVIYKNTYKEPINIYYLHGLDILSIIYLQLRYGTRICELLRSTCADICDSHSLVMRGAKSSRHRFIELPYEHPALLQPCRCGRHNIFSVSYKQVWLSYYKLEITSPPRRGGINRAVTHTGRIRFIRSLKELSLPPEAIRDIVGHKSIKSQIYYIRRSN